MVLVLSVVSNRQCIYYLFKITLLLHVYCYFCHLQLHHSLKITGRPKVFPLVLNITIIITTFNFFRGSELVAFTVIIHLHNINTILKGLWIDQYT
jgi:hypothetical protein